MYDYSLLMYGESPQRSVPLLNPQACLRGRRTVGCQAPAIIVSVVVNLVVLGIESQCETLVIPVPPSAALVLVVKGIFFVVTASVTKAQVEG